MPLIRRDVVPADCPEQSLHILRGLMERPETRWFFVEGDDQRGLFFYRARTDWPDWAPPLPNYPQGATAYWPSYLGMKSGQVMLFPYHAPKGAHVAVPSGWRVLGVSSARLEEFILWVERIWDAKPHAAIAVIVEHDTPEVPMPDCPGDADDAGADDDADDEDLPPF